MYRLSFMYGGMPHDGNKRRRRRQMRYWPDKVRILRNMRIGLPCFGDFPGKLDGKNLSFGGIAPVFILKIVEKHRIKYNTYGDKKQKG